MYTETDGLRICHEDFFFNYSRKILSRAGLEPGISAPQLAILGTTYRLCWAPTLAANRGKPNLTLAHARTALLAKFYKGIAVAG